MADRTAVAEPTVADTPDAEADARPRGRRRILVLAVVVLVLGAVGAKMFLLSPPPDDAQAAPEEGAIVPVGQMTTSLAGSGTHFVRVDLAAVLNATADAATVEKRFPLLRDRALSVLMGFTADELRTVEGADALRAALTAQAQKVWTDQQVLRIVLTDLLVQ